MVLAFIHARAVFDGGRCFPALVSSLLIRSDQLRRSMFGFRSASSTLAAQWSILRFVVQLSYRSSFASLRFASPSPSQKWPVVTRQCATGIEPAQTIRTALQSLPLGLTLRGWPPCFQRGCLSVFQPRQPGCPSLLMAPHKAAVCTLFHAPMISGLFCPPWLIPASAIKSAGRA